MVSSKEHHQTCFFDEQERFVKGICEKIKTD
jgi:hypothetical protein